MAIEDVSTEKASKYGKEFTIKIQKFSETHSLSVNETKIKPKKQPHQQQIENKVIDF